MDRSVPDDLKYIYGDTLIDRDILLRGNFPHDLTIPGNFFESPEKFKIVGKLIGYELDNLSSMNSHAPIFYVEDWEGL